jgi:hypothetical protein
MLFKIKQTSMWDDTVTDDISKIFNTRLYSQQEMLGDGKSVQKTVTVTDISNLATLMAKLEQYGGEVVIASSDWGRHKPELPVIEICDDFRE